MTIDAFTTQRNYADHVRPVWEALPPDVRGEWHSGMHPPETGVPILLASYPDLCATIGRPVAFLEHGAGASYGGDLPGFSGGSDRESVGLFLCPSETVAARNLARYPDATAAVVGNPSMDHWHTHNIAYQGESMVRHNGPCCGVERDKRPVIALAFHWDLPGPREGGTAWPVFAPHLRLLLDAGWTILGHGHPRAIDGELSTVYRHLGIEIVREASEVFDRADLLVFDVTSLGYEFASTGRPVVCLDDPEWRRDAGYYPRFCKPTSEVGLHCSDPAALVDTIWLALEDPPPVRRARQAAIEIVYSGGCDGHAAERAAAALMAWQPDFSRVRVRSGRG